VGQGERTGHALTLAFVSVVGGSTVPRLIVVERKTLSAVWTGCVMLTLADQTLVCADRRRLYTVAAVTVTLASVIERVSE